jgi:hypothetical protein
MVILLSPHTVSIVFNNFLCLTKSITRCLAHIINLATQAILKTHSKSEHYNSADPEAHEPNVDEAFRDEIGLVRAIVVKVHMQSSMIQIKPIQNKYRLVHLRNVGNFLKIFNIATVLTAYVNFYWIWLFDGHQRM